LVPYTESAHTFKATAEITATAAEEAVNVAMPLLPHKTAAFLALSHLHEHSGRTLDPPGKLEG
jgi:hypothetical protein